MALVDRLTEMGVMRGLVAGARESSSGVLVLRGQAGMGKTALLRETAGQAASAGMRVAQAVGIQAEMEMDFAGLHQLLLPFADGLPTLPVPQRAALETVFGLAAGQAADRFLVGLATLTLLTDAAESQPVLCVVDDAQWLDRVSLEVLAFVARRLLAERMGMVFGLRDGEERAEALSGFPELKVGPLPPVHGLCLQAKGRTAEAVRTLVDAALAAGPADPRRARDTMLEAFSAAQLDGWFGPENAKVAQAVRGLPRPLAEAPGDGLLDGYAAIHEGRTAEGYALLRQGVRSMAAAYDSPDSTLPRVLAWLQAAGLLFDHSTWVDLERRWIPALRDRGAVNTLIPVLFSLGYNALRDGKLSAAGTALAEGRALAEGTGNREWLDGFAVGELSLLALRGNVPEGEALAARLLGRQLQKQWRDVAHLAAALLNLGVGRYDAALDAALEARALWPLLSPEDAVEAAVRCGRPEVGRAAFDDFAPLAVAGGTPWALGVMVRCRALAGDAPRADTDYRQSVAYFLETPVVLALARSRLLYGEWLRRQRRRRDARDQLRLALESFERMGARTCELFGALGMAAFADRAGAELRAAGEHAAARPAGTPGTLTAQEAQIARLAAEGATNQEIAARLFVSASTVDYHLRKVFRKLGLTSRAQLTSALGAPDIAA